jgi:hypothetical protein
VLLASEAPVGTLVKVETGDCLFLGEICYCRPCGQAWAAGMILEHALWDVPATRRQAATFAEHDLYIPTP